MASYCEKRAELQLVLWSLAAKLIYRSSGKRDSRWALLYSY